MDYVLVFVGAGAGGALRHGVNVLSVKAWGLNFPYGTMLINIAGSLAMGLLVEYLALKGSAPQQIRLFLATGVLGGFTTFSAFSLETALLYERGQLLLAALYAAASVGLSLAALFAGLHIVRGLA
ncbi:MAG: fluoride efflux transporter CrcB [Parvibaculaceae bacterium]